MLTELVPVGSIRINQKREGGKRWNECTSKAMYF